MNASRLPLTADAVEREWYALAPPRRRPSWSVPAYRVTADGRILHACGSYVYTERHNGGSPVFPANCWRCGGPLVDD